MGVESALDSALEIFLALFFYKFHSDLVLVAAYKTIINIGCNIEPLSIILPIKEARICNIILKSSFLYKSYESFVSTPWRLLKSIQTSFRKTYFTGTISKTFRLLQIYFLLKYTVHKGSFYIKPFQFWT